MRTLQNRKTLTIFALLFVTSYVHCQDDAEDKKTKEAKPLPPPTNILRPSTPFGRTLTPTSAILVWIGPPNANNYNVVIFKADNKELVLHEEIKNVHETRIEFEDLESSTQYEVMIKSIIVHFDGTTQESEYSEPYSFKTLDACVGGMIHVSCTAHCIPTCEKPRPACDRRCVSGCSCPKDEPYLHNGKCITKLACKTAGGPVTEIIGRPTNLKLHRVKGSRDVLFTWNKVEGADFYTVIVTLKDGTIVQTIDDIKEPITLIKELKPKTQYKFKVQAKFLKFNPDSRALNIGIPPPAAPTITDVTGTSFQVQWNEFPGAESYKIAIKDIAANYVIQVFKGVNETFVKIQGLNPDTDYNVTIIIVTSEFEVESRTASATTSSAEDDGEDILNPTEIAYVATESTTTTTIAPTTAPYIPTCAQREQALKLFREENEDLDVHIPECNGDGNYESRQCEKYIGCYCVDERKGEKHPGSDFNSPKAKYALDCSGYGEYNITPLRVTASAVNSETIKVTWSRNRNVAFYIVKIFHAFQGGIVTHLSQTKTRALVQGLTRGTPYVAIVVAVNKDGKTSSDRVKGDFVATPHLDPPTDLMLEQVTKDRMKISWRKNEIALHYKVEVFGTSNGKSRTYDNVTDNQMIFPAQGKELYKVSVQSTGLTTIPGSGKTVFVSSNMVQVSKRPSCVFPPMDVIFVFDVSGSMSSEEYAKSIKFFMLLAEALTPLTTSKDDSTKIRVAGVKAFSTSRELFGFSRYDANRNLISGIKFIRQTRNKYDLKEMLQFVYKNFWQSSKHVIRQDVPSVVIAFIGGKSDTSGFENDARQLARVAKVIAVGVNGKTNNMDMSSVTDVRNRIMVNSFDDMYGGYERVMERLCNIK